MTALLELVPKWLLAAAVAALLAFSGWQTLQLSSARADVAAAQRETDQLKLAIADANTRAANQARALQAKVSEAQNDARVRETTLRAAAAAAASESDGLRNDIDTLRLQLGQLSHDAAVERASAVAAVLGQCASRYQDLAQRCDRHVSDIRTLIQAWPK